LPYEADAGLGISILFSDDCKSGIKCGKYEKIRK
jgi:hypothetical protein